MLERIEHINSNFQFKGGSSSPGFERVFQNAGSSNSNANDSIRFSPAAHFLSKVNWQLKEMSSPTKGKLILVFVSSGFEFHTEFEFSGFFNDIRHSYNIVKIVEYGNKKIKILVRLSSKKQKLLLTESRFIGEPLELKGLTALFEKIVELKESGEIDNINPVENNLLIGIEFILEDEFEYINMALYNLIRKLSGIKIPGEVEFPDDKSDSIIIEKIAAVDDRQIFQ